MDFRVTVRRLPFLLVIIFYLSILSTIPIIGLTTEFWIDGTITSPVSQENYDGVNYYIFNFTVSNTNGEYYVYVGDEILVGCPVEVASGVSLEQNGFYNFTGALNDVQVAEFPADTFKVTVINVQTTDYWSLFMQIIQALSSITKGIITAIGDLIYIIFGYAVPEIVITLFFIGGAAYVILKYLRPISIIFVIVLGFIVVSGAANIIRLLIMSQSTVAYTIPIHLIS